MPSDNIKGANWVGLCIAKGKEAEAWGSVNAKAAAKAVEMLKDRIFEQAKPLIEELRARWGQDAGAPITIKRRLHTWPNRDLLYGTQAETSPQGS